MAILKVNFLSRELGLHTKVNVILPTGRPMKLEKQEKCLYQVLWLLHGGTDDINDFILSTNIARYAEDYKIAVVIPEDNNAFYTDGYIQNGGRYFTYVTEELVNMCRSIFPFSDKREDNFISGNSMGSGGAMKCAMLRPDLYAAALILSGSGMRMHRAEDKWVKEFLEKVCNDEDVSEYKCEDYKKDVQMAIPFYEILKKGTEGLPQFFFTCGGDDVLINDIEPALKFYKKMGLDIFYEQIPGYKHEWDFWDMQLRKGLDQWLPIKKDVIYPGKEEK